MSVTNPTANDRLRWICNTSAEEGRDEIKRLMDRNEPTEILPILTKALAYEQQNANRSSLVKAIESALGKCRAAITHQSLALITNRQTTMIQTTTAASVTTDQPKDPRWDSVRETSAQLRACGRLFLRGQVKLGMQLAALKKDLGIRAGKGISTSPDSGEVVSWAEIVKRETGYSRQSCDEFIRLADACKLKLRTSKTLDLPAPVKADAITLFRADNPLTLTDDQWLMVDQVIGTLTTGETQASLLQELDLVPKPKPMPKGGKTAGGGADETTAGQLAFHFFEAVAAPMINARTNPDYKKLLYALPLYSTQEHPLSLATLETEARAMLADIEEAQQASAKPARGRVINA